VGADKINPSVIVPSVFDAKVAPAVAAAVRATVRGGRLDPVDPSELEHEVGQ
jgi:malate dehydrogenase (oxaloacetate-decarboxylating)